MGVFILILWLFGLFLGVKKWPGQRLVRENTLCGVILCGNWCFVDKKVCVLGGGGG